MQHQAVKRKSANNQNSKKQANFNIFNIIQVHHMAMIMNLRVKTELTINDF